MEKGTQLEAKRLGPRCPGIKRSACSFTRPTLRPAPARSALFKHDGSGRWMRAAPNMAFQASVTSRTAETDGILVACYHAAPARPAAGYTAVHLPQHSIAPPPHLSPCLSSPPPRVPLDTHTRSLRFARRTFFFSLVLAPGVPWLAPPDMSQVIRHVRSWTSLPSGLRKGGHRKGFSLIDKYRNDEDTGGCSLFDCNGCEVEHTR